MKTKHTNKLTVLILSVMMLVSVFCVMTVSASAAETDPPAAVISGKQVNLGGDISMKYYVTLAEGTSIEDVSLRITFLGVVTELETSTFYAQTGEYVFTFTGISPQCMGDTISAELYVGEDKIGDTDTYSVKDNLISIYQDSNDAIRQLIVDTLEYGSAAQVYQNYKTDALVKNALVDEDNNIIADNDDDRAPVGQYTLVDTDDNVRIHSANVRFSYMNSLIFKLTPSGISGLQLNGADVSAESEGGYSVVWKNGIAPTDFDAAQLLTSNNGFSLSYSINSYCREIVNDAEDGVDNYSAEMEALAKALYNYGVSAEVVQHASKGEHENVTYTADEASIKATCPACGEIGTLTLKAPENLEYDGTEKSVTLKGSIPGVNPSINYEGERTNVTADGFTAMITIDGVTATLKCKIEKADVVYTAPTANELTYSENAQELITAGSATGGEMQYKLDDGAYSTEIPTAINAGTYTVYYKVVGDGNHNDVAAQSVTLTIGKANATATAPNANALIYNGSAQALVTAGSATGGTMQYAIGTDGTTAPTEGWSEAIPTGTQTGTYYVWYKVEGDTNHKDVAAQCITVTIVDHVHNYTFTAREDGTIEATCNGAGTCPYETASATITATDAIYTGSEIKAATVSYKNWMEAGLGNLEIVFTNNTNVGTATATIITSNGKAATVTFEITRDPDTEEFDGEWVIIPEE